MEGGVLSYGPSNRFDASLFGFKGEHRGMVGRTGRWDWGMALEFAPTEKLRIGLSYLSDLAEAGEGLLERGARYEQRVAGWNGFVEISAGRFTGTAEIVRALDSFVELEAEVDRPTAWNLELAGHAEAPVIAAVRLEGSRKLDGAPRRQIGASLIWGIRPNLTLTLEYLHSRYAPGLREDAAENEIERTRKLGAQLSFNFCPVRRAAAAHTLPRTGFCPSIQAARNSAGRRGAMAAP